MQRYEILAGLPPYGPEALPFSATGQGTHSEGFVVRFFPEFAEAWIGNFQPGFTSLCTIVDHPDHERFIVVSGGQAYVVNPACPQHWEHFGGAIEYVLPIDELEGVVLGNGLWFEMMGAKGMIWRTPRISWDGMRNIQVSDLELTGQALEPTDTWYDFKVDLVDGKVEGGSYMNR